MDQAGVKEGLTATAADCTLMVYLMVGVNARRLFLLRILQPARFLLGGIFSRSASWPAHSDPRTPATAVSTVEKGTLVTMCSGLS